MARASAAVNGKSLAFMRNSTNLTQYCGPTLHVQAKLHALPKPLPLPCGCPHPPPARAICRWGFTSTCPFAPRPATSAPFIRKRPTARIWNRYLAGIERELALAGPGRPADTVFLGRRHASALPARDLARLGPRLARHLGAPPHEWTVEMAPSSVKADKLEILRDLGVNRISLGVQSFCSHHLGRARPAVIHPRKFMKRH